MKRGRNKKSEIYPDEIFLDSSNLPEFDTDQFEGRIEKAIEKKNLFWLGGFFILIALVFVGRIWFLEVKSGKLYAERSQNNHLKEDVIIANRGIITDRNGEKLAWNEISPDQSDFTLRKYTDSAGFDNLLGYIKYPAKDSNGFYYRTTYTGADGIEKYYDNLLSGDNGMKITEVNAVGQIESQSVEKPPKNADTLTLSVDSKVQNEFYKILSQTAGNSGFTGAAGIIVDVKTGQILSMVTYPSYNSNILSDGNATSVSNYLNNPGNPFLDRAVSGLYAPGSIIKPYLALAALNENVISPDKQILSTGSISIPNPYFPNQKSVFNDWRVNGWTNMEEALAVSSDVYFYEIGGGYQDQRGLGIANIEKYTKMFGFGSSVKNSFFDGPAGTIPSPEWKAANFNGDIWRIGDTYHTSIGQYGFQVSPIQIVRAMAAIANNGTLLDPTLLNGVEGRTVATLPFTANQYDVVKKGMRMAVTQGTVTALNTSAVPVAAKTGTAEIGTAKQYINSWVEGFFPYETPRYAFVIVMEKGPAHYAEGAPAVMRNLLDWMSQNTPEYLH
jgi:penicillin-binding protein 2